MLDLLDSWPWNFGGVLIGGYAIAAYGRPRYSDDVDIVATVATHDKLKAFIMNQGLSLENSSIPNPQNYDGKVFRYIKEELTLDVLVGYVGDREALVDLPELWISKNCRVQHLITLTGKTSNRIPIACPEALWALKLQSGRDHDITDLFSISKTKIDVNEVVNVFISLKSKSLVDKLIKTSKKLRFDKLYEDSMSRTETKRTDKSKNDWNRFINQVQHIVSKVIET